MAKLGFGIASVLALLSGACSDDGAESKSTTGGSGGTGGGSGSGGQAGAGGGAGAPSCDGTQSTDQKLSQAMKVLRDALAKDNVPGGAFAVVKDGKLVDLGVAGSKRGSVCDPITPDTLFRTMYATQLITSIAALDAVEDGELSLMDPITDFVPTLSVSHGNAQEIRLHHLLSSSSMLHRESKADVYCANLADTFANAKDLALWATPGSMSDWDKTGIELAGLALENVDKKPFADAVAERVLGPLAMGGAFDTATILATDHSFGHYGPAEAQMDADCRNRDPSTQYFGSIRDMAKLAEYLTGGAGQILDQSTLDAMLSKQGPHFFSADHMVYGAAGTLGHDAVWHDSNGWGFSSAVEIFKERRLAVITLMNISHAPDVAFTLSDAVAHIYDPSIKPWPSADTPVPASLPSLVATYRDDLGFNGTGPRTLEVFLDPADSGNLAGTISGSAGTSEPVSFAGFYSADNFDLTLGPNTYWARFWRDDTGNGYAVSLDLDGQTGPPFFRVP